MRNQEWDALVRRLISQGILKSPPVIEALRRVPRHLFTPENMKSYAAVDSPLPTGHGQTISAPHS